MQKRREERSGKRLQIVMRGCLRVMMLGAVALVMAFGGMSPLLLAQTKTTVADTIHGPDGSLPSGKIVISASSTFTGADGSVVLRGTVATATVTDGAFSVALIPNAGSTPSGTSYTVIYELSGVPYRNETWVVPASTTAVNLAAVRSATLSGPTAMISSSQMPALTGDVTSSAGSTATKITASSITSALTDKGGQVFNVKAYGATGSGTTDDTAAIQAAWNAAMAAHGRLYAPPGTYLITSSLTCTDANGFVFEGAGDGATSGVTFLWGGNSSSAMFALSSCRNYTFRGFSVQSSSSKPLLAAFTSINDGVAVPTAGKFENLFIQGTNLNGLDYGFHWETTGAGGNANNDDSTFIDVGVSNYTDTAWQFDGGEMYGMAFFHCGFEGASGAPSSYGVYTLSNINWYGGTGGANTAYDFFLGGGSRPSMIDGFLSEGSAQFLVGATTSAWRPTTVEDCFFDSTSLASTGYAIVWNNAGPLTLIDNGFGTNNVSKALSINIGTVSGLVNAIGNVFVTTLTPQTVFSGYAQNVVQKNTVITTTGSIHDATSVPFSGYATTTYSNLPGCNAALAGSSPRPISNSNVNTAGAVITAAGSPGYPVMAGCMQSAGTPGTYEWVVTSIAP